MLSINFLLGIIHFPIAITLSLLYSFIPVHRQEFPVSGAGVIQPLRSINLKISSHAYNFLCHCYNSVSHDHTQRSCVFFPVSGST